MTYELSATYAGGCHNGSQTTGVDNKRFTPAYTCTWWIYMGEACRGVARESCKVKVASSLIHIQGRKEEVRLFAL